MSEAQTIRTPIIIETSRYRIAGNVAVPLGERLSDYANDPDRSFFAVTEARVAPLDYPERDRPVEFVLVARHEVGLISPGWDETEAVDHMAVWDLELAPA